MSISLQRRLVTVSKGMCARGWYGRSAILIQKYVCVYVNFCMCMCVCTYVCVRFVWFQLIHEW